MAKTITQTVVFKNTTAKALFELYMDAKKHTDATGWPTKISKKEGARFDSGGGYITGRNLYLRKNEMIVESWRASDWSARDADSIFMLVFEQEGENAVIHMRHANLPDKHASGIKNGWIPIIGIRGELT